MNRVKLSLFWLGLSISVAAAATAGGATKQESKHGSGKDNRQQVDLPAPMKEHMMANMRDHLVVINEIQAALAAKNFDKVEELAENRLGLSSFQVHGASHLGRYMPEGMRRAGTDMHRAASQLALIAKEGDLQTTIAGLAEVTGRCVACHATYRVN